jgi:hypothetical protein
MARPTGGSRGIHAPEWPRERKGLQPRALPQLPQRPNVLPVFLAFLHFAMIVEALRVV